MSKVNSIILLIIVLTSSIGFAQDATLKAGMSESDMQRILNSTPVGVDVKIINASQNTISNDSAVIVQTPDVTIIPDVTKSTHNLEPIVVTNTADTNALVTNRGADALSGLSPVNFSSKVLNDGFRPVSETLNTVSKDTKSATKKVVDDSFKPLTEMRTETRPLTTQTTKADTKNVIDDSYKPIINDTKTLQNEFKSVDEFKPVSANTQTTKVLRAVKNNAETMSINDPSIQEDVELAAKFRAENTLNEAHKKERENIEASSIETRFENLENTADIPSIEAYNESIASQLNENSAQLEQTQQKVIADGFKPVSVSGFEPVRTQSPQVTASAKKSTSEADFIENLNRSNTPNNGSYSKVGIVENFNADLDAASKVEVRSGNVLAGENAKVLTIEEAKAAIEAQKR